MADRDFALKQHIRSTKPRRELYIGNCSESMTVESLGTFLAGAIKKLGLGEDPLLQGTSFQDETPVVRCSIGASSKFAFLEMRTVQICANCLLLTGIEFQNQTLKVMRPKAFQGLDTGPSMCVLVEPRLLDSSPEAQHNSPLSHARARAHARTHT